MFSMSLLRRKVGFATLPTNVAAIAAFLVIASAPAAVHADVPESTFYTFEESNDLTLGVGPAGQLVQGNNGEFYGVLTSNQQFANGGSIYKISLSKIPRTVYLLNSSSMPDMGYNPTSIIIGSDGNIYGTTEWGGSTYFDGENTGFGTIFKLTPSGTYTVLHRFTGSDGERPANGIVQGTDGVLYGTTEYGGAGFDAKTGKSKFGVVYSCTTSGDFTLLHSFTDPIAYGSTDGSYPIAPPLYGSNGVLYGTTEFGGTGYAGIIYAITTTGVETILHTFNPDTFPNDGEEPVGGLVQDSLGTLYGVTSFGGAAYYDGTLYKLSETGTGYAILHSFADGTVADDGKAPQATLIFGGDGNLYGTTRNGGTKGNGTVFEATTSGQETPLFSFSKSNVQDPIGQLSQGYDGSLYGLAALQNSTDLRATGAIYKLKTGLPVLPGVLAAFTLDKASATGGSENADGVVTIAAPAGPGGVQVKLASSNTSAATVDTYAYVMEGLTTTHFRVTSHLAASATPVTITVSTNGLSSTALLTILPAEPIASLTSDRMTFVGGSRPPTLTITLASPAPATGENVAVTTTDSNAAYGPVTVAVAAGAMTATFEPKTHGVTEDEMVTITATAGGKSKSVTLTVNAS